MLALAAIALCAQCHPKVVQDHLASPMGRSSGPVVASAEIPGTFRHPASNTRFDLRRGPGGFELAWGRERVTLALYIGSRHNGRSYAWQTGDYLYQAPVGYYSERKAWDMAPGYFQDRTPDLDRPITRECLFCHSSGARFATATQNRVINWAELSGISCERCHGDGAQHARSPSRSNIINPKRLESIARDSICEQCHLSGKARIPLAGKRLEDFQPGQRLSAYLDVFLAQSNSGVSVTGHAEALSRSKCKQASGDRLWCGTCHSIHSPVANVRERCMSCHSQPHDTADCTGCHMPKANANDGGHTIFTDHFIARRPTSKNDRPIEELVRYYPAPQDAAAAQRSLGLAYAELANQTGNPRWTERAWPLLRSAAQSRPADPALLTELAWLLQQSGNPAKAIELYRASLAQDPYQLPALVNLAGLLEQAGNKKEARDLFDRALVVNPRQTTKSSSCRTGSGAGSCPAN